MQLIWITLSFELHTTNLQFIVSGHWKWPSWRWCHQWDRWDPVRSCSHCSKWSQGLKGIMQSCFITSTLSSVYSHLKLGTLQSDIVIWHKNYLLTNISYWKSKVSFNYSITFWDSINFVLSSIFSRWIVDLKTKF